MEKTLRALFDYQKFEENADLKKVIDSVHSKYGTRELDLDELEWVAAAGTPNLDPKKNPFGNQQ